MLSILYLQSEFFGLIVLILLILVIVIPIAIWKSRKKSRPERDDGYDPTLKFADILANVPKKDQVDALAEEFESMREFLRAGYDEQNRVHLERLTEISEKNEKEVQEKMVEHVKKLLEDNSVATRDEIDRIVERLDKVVVDDSNTKQFEIMGNLFDSTDVKVINWKCNLLKLLRNGVAPNIDEEKFVRNGIPLGSVSSFLKKLVEEGIVNENKIDSYSMDEEYEWVYSYIEKPVWLKKQIENVNVVRKEKDYQRWLKDNLEKIEDGLIKEEKEYVMVKTGTIDFLCRDIHGQPVGLELKYPKASKRDVKQLIAYSVEFSKRVDGSTFRGMMIAPTIVQELRKSLEDNNLEWKEIPFGDESEKAVPAEEEKESGMGSMPRGWDEIKGFKIS